MGAVNHLVEDIVLVKLLGCHSLLECSLLADEFKDPTRRSIFEAMQRLDQQGEWDFVVLSGALAGDTYETLQLITDGRYFDRDVLKLEVYERELRARNQKNLVREVVEEHGGADPYVVMVEIQSAMSRSVAPDPALTVEKCLSSIYAEAERMASGESAGLQTGLRALDQKIYGLRPGNLYVVGARPSMGKSVFALNIALAQAAAGKRVYVQALEENREDFYRRAAANVAGFNLRDLVTGNLTGDDWGKFFGALEQIKTMPLIVDDTTGLRSTEIAQRIAKCHAAAPLALVIVDHLQEIYNPDAQNRHLAISEALNDLRVVTKNNRIPCMVLCQINRAVESRNEKRPQLSDLKESGDIEAKADCVMLLYREKYYKKTEDSDTLEILIAKHRNGERGTLELSFNGAHMRIRDLEGVGGKYWQGS